MTYDAANRLTKEDYSNADHRGEADMNYANTYDYLCKGQAGSCLWNGVMAFACLWGWRVEWAFWG